MVTGGGYLSPFSHLEVGFRQNQACSLAPQARTILGWTVPTSDRNILPSKVNGGHQEGQQYRGVLSNSVKKKTAPIISNIPTPFTPSPLFPHIIKC